MPTTIIIPFREQADLDRRGQLAETVCHLRRLVVGAKILVVEQTLKGKFHRGALLNTGFEWAMKAWPETDFAIMHDCDLVPDAAVAALYDKPKPFVCLAGGPGCRWCVSPTFVGGVTGVMPDAFVRMNGYPITNAYGWGGEDDALRRRAKSAGVLVHRNTEVGSYIDLENTSVQQKLTWLKLHEEQKNMHKWALRDQHDRTWKTDGLNGPCAEMLQHTVTSSYDHLLVEVPPEPCEGSRGLFK